MSFGWSVGDIVTAISLIVDIANSLREVHGAKSDYQATISSLEGLLSALEIINRGAVLPQNAISLQANQAKNLAETQIALIEQPVDNFVKEVKPKYEKYMGESSAKKFLHGAHRKAKWAMFVVERVDSLKRQIDLPLKTLHLLRTEGIITSISGLPSETSREVLSMLSQNGVKISSSVPAGPWVLLPYTTNPAYVHREKVFQRLQDLLKVDEHSGSASQHKRAALWGLGGTGKTQIAIQYAYWLHEREPKTSIFWVHASSGARFQESYDQIGATLGVPGIEDPSQNSKLLVRRKLMVNDVGPWLMIVDNADDNHLMYSGPNLARYLPNCPHGRIIATTRDRQIAISMTENRGTVEVPKMEPNESEQLVNNMMSTTDLKEKDKEDIKRLSQTLDYLPLAISQAAAYIHTKSLDIHTYLQVYQRKELELLSTTFESPGRENLEVPNAVVATWKLSLEWIQSQDSRAVDMLSLMAFYDRQGIPSRLLQQENEDRLSFIESSATLINFSLIRQNKIADSYELHRLVHMVIRSWVHEQGGEKEDQIAKDALMNISSAFPEAILDKWTDCAVLVPHGRAVLQHQISSPSGNHILQRASLLHKMAQYLLEAGEYTSAKDMEEEAMNLRTAQRGTEDPDTIASMSNLALIYQRQGRNDEAERLLVQGTETRIRLYGWDHPDTLASLAQLAQLCLATNRPHWATQIFHRTLRARKNGDGESIINSRNRLHILLDLATSYSLEGELQGAEELVVNVLDELKTLYGSTDPDSIRAMIDLAGIYATQDKWDEAQELWTNAIMLSHQLSSAEHPLAFRAMSRLGRAYSLNNRLKEAEDLQLKVILWSKATFGFTHFETQRAAKDLAQTYNLNGRGDLARNLELEILKAGKEATAGSRELFERLVLPDGTMNIILHSISCDMQLLKNIAPGSVSRDSIIILMHGPPGSGKTGTAYGAASFTHKPIIPLLWGSVGLPIREIKDNLEFYNRLAQNHDCILLLDNGDELLRGYVKKDTYLSQINFAFLNTLKSISGCLMITTNRLGSFDDAIYRQIDIALYFPTLDREVSRRIWRRHMDEARNDAMNFVVDESSVLTFADELYDRHRSQNSRFNGSQIRNLFVTALALAKYEYMSKSVESPSDAAMTGPVLDRGVFQRAASSSLNIDGFMSGPIWSEVGDEVTSATLSYDQRIANLRRDNFSLENDTSVELHAEDLPAEDRPLDSSGTREAWASRLSAISSDIEIEADNITEEMCCHSDRTWTLRTIDRFIRMAIVFAMFESWEFERPVKNIALQARDFANVEQMESSFDSYLREVSESNFPKRAVSLSVREDNYCPII